MDIAVHNLRDFTHDVHKTVDDTPYGGGAGMVMKVEPIYRAVGSIISNFPVSTQADPSRLVETTTCRSEADASSSRGGQFPPPAGGSNEFSNSNSKISKPENTRIILFSAKGKRYTQRDAVRLSKYENIIMICGRYEGVDERVAQNLVDEEISIGDFVLTGGEIPAMVLVDSLTRLVPGVLGNEKSIEIESHSEEGYLEYPQYTKPDSFKDWPVPEVLLSGNHEKIAQWREAQSKRNKQI